MSALPDCLEGAIDLHVHSSPDVDIRRFNDLELAGEAKRAGTVSYTHLDVYKRQVLLYRLPLPGEYLRFGPGAF